MTASAQISPPSSAASLPDVNVQTTPFEVVQHLLDQVAYLNLFAIPVTGHREVATLTPEQPKDYFGINGGYGMDIRSSVHRFETELRVPSPQHSLDVSQVIGESAGHFNARFFIAPDDVTWQPGKQPPIRMFDPWRSQAFTAVDVDIAFDTGNDDGRRGGLKGYAVGRTYPMVIDGRPKLFMGAVGNVTEGYGHLRGAEGTFTLNGSLVDLGFRGNIACRLLDPEGRWQADRDLPAPSTLRDTDQGTTWVVMRGEKADPSVRTEYGPPPDAQQVSLVTPAQMRDIRYRLYTGGSDGMKVRGRRGQVCADLEATVLLDILAPPGTADRPNAFTTRNVYRFLDNCGGTAGRIQAHVDVGRSWNVTFPSHPRQPAMRYGGFGPIEESDGIFQGARGLVTVNSAIGIAPHTLSMLNILQIVGSPDTSTGGTSPGGDPR